jgi:hypothetical protein
VSAPPRGSRQPCSGLFGLAWRAGTEQGRLRKSASGESRIKTGGLHYQKWFWHELSLVTIPANMSATISLIKSYDEGLPAASGNGEVRPGVKIDTVKKGVKIGLTEQRKEVTFLMSRNQIEAFRLMNPEARMKRCERSRQIIAQSGDPVFNCTFVQNI